MNSHMVHGCPAPHERINGEGHITSLVHLQKYAPDLIMKNYMQTQIDMHSEKIPDLQNVKVM